MGSKTHERVQRYNEIDISGMKPQNQIYIFYTRLKILYYMNAYLEIETIKK